MTGLEGKEVVVFLADVPLGGVAALHYHPGHEAIYMLQGSLLFEPEQVHGRPTSPAIDHGLHAVHLAFE
jgi:quercetin dioxygenase-like cupin family protein